MAYRLDLPKDIRVHPVFHISQLKSFHPNYTLVFSKLPMLTDLQASNALPAEILERRLVRKGNNAIPQVLVTWTGLLATLVTWEDYHVLKARFPAAPTWGQAETSTDGAVITTE